MIRRALLFALPAAWILSNVVTLRWDQSDAWDFRPPLWGFPLPWAQWNVASSLHWDIAAMSLLVDLLVFAVPIFFIVERFHSKLPRFVPIALAVVSALFVFSWGAGFASGWHSFVPMFSTEHVTHVAPVVTVGFSATK